MSMHKVVLVALTVIFALSFGGSRVLAAPPTSVVHDPDALGPGFTYQGFLKDDGGDPITDLCNFQFTLFDAASTGNQIGLASTVLGVQVTNGYFTTTVNSGGEFGATAFNGAARWLQISVKCSSDSNYIPLTPLQQLTPAPYALNADLVDGKHASAFSLNNHDHWGASWSGIGNGLTLSSSDGFGLKASGTYAISGTSGDSIGIGVTGVAAATSGNTYGVEGEADSTNGTGVYGYAAASSGYTKGVYGVADSTNGTGLYGDATATSGITHGVYGEVHSTNGTGVYGYASPSSGNAYGVIGRSASSNGMGVFGYDTASSGGTRGVEGDDYSSTGIGVEGYASATSGASYGMYGIALSTGGTGVYGDAFASSGTTYGVYGEADSTLGTAGYFINSSGSGVTRGWGVRALTGSGGTTDVHPSGNYLNAAGEFAGPNGVIGAASSDASGGVGVTGISAGTNGSGVHGVASSTSGTTFGVYGEAQSTSGRGVAGFATANSGAAYGVAGESDSSSGFGVYGYEAATSGSTAGVYGYNASSSGTGAYGYSAAASGTTYGVRGTSASTGGYGGWFSSPGVGLFVRTTTTTGNVNIIEGWSGNSANLRFSVSNVGNVLADGTYSSPAQDYAEMLAGVDGLQPGDVLVIGPDGKLALSTQAYQLSVVGVYSTQPGFVGGASDDSSSKVPLAVVGVVPVKVSAENGAIKPGDLLTTSSTPGHAMKANTVTVNGITFYPSGTLIGKALEGLDSGTGTILVLVTLQ